MSWDTLFQMTEKKTPTLTIYCTMLQATKKISPTPRRVAARDCLFGRSMSTNSKEVMEFVLCASQEAAHSPRNFGDIQKV